MKCCALIPAGGKSTRMGRPKLALELGGQTLLERVVATFHTAGIRDVLVVLGPHVAELAELAASAKAQVHLLPAETPDMRATIEAGLTWLEANVQPDAWLLAPADHPALDAVLVRELLTRAEGQPGRVVLPTHGGQRGHPAIIPWSLVPELKGLPAGQGFNRFFRANPERIVEVSVASADVLLDLNTPEEYERFRKRFG